MNDLLVVMKMAEKLPIKVDMYNRKVVLVTDNIENLMMFVKAANIAT